jgi:hypothetical protein
VLPFLDEHLKGTCHDNVTDVTPASPLIAAVAALSAAIAEASRWLIVSMSSVHQPFSTAAWALNLPEPFMVTIGGHPWSRPIIGLRFSYIIHLVSRRRDDCAAG